MGNCDAMDGPLIERAREALETENVNHVLPWVRPADEHEIRHAFEHALAVRRLSGRARDLADLHFFETLVRFHRAAEGAPYAGLRPAGEDIAPVVPAAEQALDTGMLKTLAGMLTDAVRSGLHRHFEAAVAGKSFAVDDVAAGRRFVEAYERYIHYVERIWQAATPQGAGPAEEGVRGDGHGKPARTTTLLGSTAQGVIRSAKPPVLLVTPPSPGRR